MSKKINYNYIFQKGEHYLTVRDRATNTANRSKIGSMRQLEREIRKQPVNSDMFITKYPENCIVDCIILDLDSEDDKSLALEEARTIQSVTNEKGLNTVIVSSGKKGYHIYIQVPFRPFMDRGLAHYHLIDGWDYSIYFEEYINLLIDKEEDTYLTLDMTNTSAGLKGNIRVIGSVHPSTNKRCRVIDGEFLPFQAPTELEWWCLKTAWKDAKTKCEKSNNDKSLSKMGYGAYSKITSDPVADNDLRTLIPQIFGLTVNDYGRYVMANCPFHNDRKPSLKITKEWFYCLSCQERGNWYTLRRKGYITEEMQRIKELE